MCKQREGQGQGGSAVEHLPSAQGVILESWDRVPHWAPGMESASPSSRENITKIEIKGNFQSHSPIVAFPGPQKQRKIQLKTEITD